MWCVCWAEPNAAGSSTNKPRGCFVQGKGLVLGLHVPVVPGKLSAVITCFNLTFLGRGSWLLSGGWKRLGEGHQTAKNREYIAE